MTELSFFLVNHITITTHKPDVNRKYFQDQDEQKVGALTFMTDIENHSLTLLICSLNKFLHFGERESAGVSGCKGGSGTEEDSSIGVE